MWWVLTHVYPTSAKLLTEVVPGAVIRGQAFENICLQEEGQQTTLIHACECVIRENSQSLQVKVSFHFGYTRAEMMHMVKGKYV